MKTNNCRLSQLSPGDAKALERWMRHRRGEYTVLEILEETVGAVTAMLLIVAIFAIVIHL